MAELFLNILEIKNNTSFRHLIITYFNDETGVKCGGGGVGGDDNYMLNKNNHFINIIFLRIYN